MDEEPTEKGLIRILAIDDEISVIATYKMIFKGKAELDTLETCGECIDKILENPDFIKKYRVVITDLNQLPSGYDVIKKVNGSCPVIVVSGDQSETVEEKVKDMGGFHFRKPVDAKLFPTKVIEIITEHKYQGR